MRIVRIAGQALLCLGVIICAFAVVLAWGSFANTFSNADDLLKTSDLVFTGKVVSGAPIVRKNRLEVVDSSSWKFPSPDEYLLGNEFVLEVDRLIKPKAGKREFVRVFVPGVGPREGDPILIIGKEYLLFVKEAKLNDDFVDAIAVRSANNLEAPENRFDSSSYFIVNGGNLGCVADRKKIAEYLKRH